MRPERGFDPDADATATGRSGAWLNAMIEADPRGLSSEGDWRLPRDLHKALFAGMRG